MQNKTYQSTFLINLCHLPRKAYSHEKCNEAKPQCANCQRLQVTCSFASQTATPILHPSSIATLSTPLATPPAFSAATQPLSLLDLELYHHFIYAYGTSLITDANVRDQIFENILELGLRHDFLIHNFMALSALHLYQRDRSRSDLFDRACYLQGVAIQHVQPVIANLQEEDSLAALLFSGHTAAFGLAEFMLNPHHDNVDPIDKIIECFQLSRGVKVVVSPHWGYLKDTWLKVILDKAEAHEDQVRATIATDFPTYSMVRSLAFGQDDPERRQRCLKVVEDIFTFIGITASHPNDVPTSTHFIDGWVVQLPAAFKDMLVERRPIALIILAYWAVLTSINPRAWHLRGLAELLMARIETILGSEWSEFLRWPRDRIAENARAAQDTPSQTPSIDNHNVDSRLSGMHLPQESSFSLPCIHTLSSQPSPYHITSNQPSPYSNPASNQHSPYDPTSNQPSPYHTGARPGPYSQGPPIL